MEAELRKTYAGRRVLVTGHTGFKGSWLTLWLRELGAEVTGYALPPETDPSLFDAAGVRNACRHVEADVLDLGRLRGVLRETHPEFVFHLAAQALVRRSYSEPLETLNTNVMGTANLLETVRQERLRCAIVVVTSDKCYENREWSFGYREDDPMGGHDVYSMSKGAAELVTASFRRSFFPPERWSEHGVAVASARAGNVIGGGDWSRDRIVPDIVRALSEGQPVRIRNPAAIRPWQHVLEPLGGYLLLGSRLAGSNGNSPARFCEGWNFGPRVEDAHPVRTLVRLAIDLWGQGEWEDQSEPGAPHEAGLLRLSIEKANGRLGWKPRWTFRRALEKTLAWYRAHLDGLDQTQLQTLCLEQIREYQESES